MLVAGNSSGTAGCAYLWQYNGTTNEWGNYESDGAFSARTGDTFTPHDLSKTSAANGDYGRSCSISADGLTALVAGYSSTSSGGAWVWRGIDNGERAALTLSGEVYASVLPIDPTGNYQVVMAAKDVTGNVGFGELASGGESDPYQVWLYMLAPDGGPNNNTVNYDHNLLSSIFMYDTADAWDPSRLTNRVRHSIELHNG